MVRRLAIGAVAAALLLPATALANGDPASDYLLARNVFLPFNAKPDNAAVKRLEDLLEAAAKSKFPIRVAVIGTPGDLGTAAALFRKPQEYAEFLGRELSFLYRERLLVVMPNGFGYAVNGNPDPKVSPVLKTIPPPGPGATGEVEAARLAVDRVAAAEGREITVPKDSAAKDRIIIAAAVLAGIAFVAAVLLYRRRREPPVA